MKEGYAVQILKWGEPILTIERNMLAGSDLTQADEDAIRDAAEHLKSFVGSHRCRYVGSLCEICGRPDHDGCA